MRTSLYHYLLLAALAIGLFLAGLAVAAGTAAAAGNAGRSALDNPSFSVSSFPQTARPGSTVSFTVQLAGLVNSCALAAPGGTASAYTADSDHVLFSFAVRPDARPGSRQLVFRCDALPAQSVRLTILAPRHGRAGQRGAIVLFRIQANAEATPLTPARAAIIAAGWWAVSGPDYLNTFKNGQCTDWATQKRPDVIKAIEVARYVSGLLKQPFPSLDWTAKNWALLAEAAGLTVKDTPAQGALVVYQPGVDAADAGSGHVAYVESATAATFTTSDENVGAPYQMGSFTHSSTPESGRLFIYP